MSNDQASICKGGQNPLPPRTNRPPDPKGSGGTRLALVDKLSNRVDFLEAAIRVEIAELEQRTNGISHWEGCHESHSICAAIKRLRAALEG